MKKYGIGFVVWCIVALSSQSCKKNDQFPLYPANGSATQTTYEWAKIADSAQNSLSLFYNVGDKSYNATNSSSDWTQYWPTAHALDVLTDGFLRTGDATYKTKMQDLLTGLYSKNGNKWINHYYDDMEWLALASLRALDATGDPRFSDIANTLWTDIKTGWSTDLSGGIWWNKDRQSKNTPSNMPASIFAARMYNRSKNNADLDWAKKIYDWQKANLYEPSSGLVYDNINIGGSKNTTWKFTYNQGTFAGAAYELHLATGDMQYLNDAIKVADYGIAALSNNGILKSEGGGDGGLFKGIFVRYLTQMIVGGKLTSDKAKSYATFLKANAEMLWSKGTNKKYPLFNTSWEIKPGEVTDFTTQLSGIMLLEAVADLKKKNIIE